MSYNKTDRISELLHRELMAVIGSAVKDPRLPKFITITAVKVTRDLAHAKVYLTVLEAEQQALAIKILNQAAGFLRSALAKRLSLRTTPRLFFVYDESIAHALYMDNLIERLSATG